MSLASKIRSDPYWMSTVHMSIAAFVAIVVCAILPSPASAAAPAFDVDLNHAPTSVPKNDEFVSYTVAVENTGDAATSGTTSLFLDLPQGMVLAAATGSGWSCHLSSQSCTSTAVVAPGDDFTALTMNVWIEPSQAPSTAVATAVAFGGGAAEDASATDVLAFAPATPFAITEFAAKAVDGAGNDYVQAGGHPFSASTSLAFTTRKIPSNQEAPVESVRDLVVDLPPGLVGNLRAVPTICTWSEVKSTSSLAEVCPASAIVGGVGVRVTGFADQSQPLYRIVPEDGYVAAFAFKPVNEGGITVVLRASVRSNGDYGVRAVAPLPPQLPELLAINFATLCTYGAKTSPGLSVVFDGCRQKGEPGARSVPFVSLPTACPGEEPVTKVAVDSYQNVGRVDSEGFPDLTDPNWKTAEAKSPAIEGCEALEFEPTVAVDPTSQAAASPSGLDFNLHIPQDGLSEADGLATPHLKETTLTLPQGMVVNPSAGNGLGACLPSEVGLTTPVGQTPAHFTGEPADCPNNSKVGSVAVTTPLLDKALVGSLFLAKQNQNPFGSLLALYLSIHDPETGVVVKLAGKVSLDPVTGQLSVAFTENPQVPFEDLELTTFEGPRASLATPDVCGKYATTGSLTPWSAPQSGPPAAIDDSFDVNSPAAGSSVCPQTKAQRPFALGFSAGVTNPVAGAHSPFSLRITRPDGSQELDTVSVTTPPGFAASLKGVAVCPESSIAAAGAAGRTGTAELANPSCPATSQVGTTTIGAGVGSDPYYVKTGKAYLTGPYNGGPLGLVFVVPAVAGPFDLGVQVVRTSLRVNPQTAQITAVSDPIPKILEGIPLQIRDVQVDVDRPGFSLNPTNCSVMSVNGQVTGAAAPWRRWPTASRSATARRSASSRT